MKLSTLLADIVSPNVCCICDEIIGDFFSEDEIFFQKDRFKCKSPFCEKCTRELEKSFSPAKKQIKNTPCDAIYLFPFADQTLIEALYHIKRQECKGCRQFFADLLQQVLEKGIPQGKKIAITYIPRSPMLLEKYGFDQTKEIVGTFVRSYGGEITELFYRDQQHKTPQKGLDYKKRFENAEKSLKSECKPPECDIIAVFDDMVTTGATAGVAYRLLSKSTNSDIKFFFIAGRINFKERRKSNE